nr:YkgJ family cysteine cluster protein [Staphylothermus hellenicus]
MLCGDICCNFQHINDCPLVFPWERRILLEIGERQGKKLVFKPYMGYKINNNRYTVVFYRWIINGKCPFLSEKGLCIIHDKKPYSCKMFPLIIGIDDNTLRVSGACPWITRHIEKIRNSDPSKIFRNEYKIAVKVFMIIKIIEEITRSNRWKRIIFTDKLLGQKDIILIDIDNIIGNIEKQWLR